MTPQELLAWFISGVISLIIILYYSGKSYNRQWTRPKIKHNKLTKYNWMVSHPENFKLGNNVDIGAFTYIQAEYGVEIQDNVQIGSHCSIYSKNTIENINCRIIIKKGAKIGSGTIIIPHKALWKVLIIEENVVIGANSVVRYGIGKNCIAVGTPAKVIGNIYDSGL